MHPPRPPRPASRRAFSVLLVLALALTLVRGGGPDSAAAVPEAMAGNPSVAATQTAAVGPATPVAADPAALATLPAGYEAAYRKAGRDNDVPWQLLAGIGQMETTHGTSPAPGVSSGVNAAGCCAGPMQFSVLASVNTWGTWAVDGDGDGVVSVYDRDDAVASAGRYVAHLRKIVGDRGELMLAAYNAGPGAVLRYGGVPPYAETTHYADGGMKFARRLGYLDH